MHVNKAIGVVRFEKPRYQWPHEVPLNKGSTYFVPVVPQFGVTISIFKDLMAIGVCVFDIYRRREELVVFRVYVVNFVLVVTSLFHKGLYKPFVLVNKSKGKEKLLIWILFRPFLENCWKLSNLSWQQCTKLRLTGEGGGISCSSDVVGVLG